MQTKIFKHCLLAVIAVLTFGTTVSAQDSLAVPPMPPVKLKFNKEFKQNMADLKVKMKQLQKHMAKQNFKMKMDMDLKFAFKDFDKNLKEGFKDLDNNFKELGKSFNDNFKDFGKSFSGSFSELNPNFPGNPNNGNSSNSISGDEYRKKVASGEMKEKVKTYSKSYSVDANDIVQISNSFGKVVVNTWAKNEVKVDVEMRFGADDEDYVNSMINGSSIVDSKVGSVISFKTNLAHVDNRTGSNHTEINYTVYMPAGNALDLTNKFGNVTLPDLSGKVSAKVSFGNLTARQLTNTQNDIQIKYTENGISTIAIFNGGKLRVGYANVKIGVLTNADADISFSSMNIGRLKNSVVAHVKYGDGMDIGTIDKSVKNMNINASFTNIKFDFKEADSFNFDVVTKLGDFNYNDDKIKVTAKSPSDEERGWSSTKSYKGYIGKNNSDGKIAITASYTNVKFN